MSTHACPADFTESTQLPVVPDKFTYPSPQQTTGGAACSVNPTNSKFLRFGGTRTCPAADHYWEDVRPPAISNEFNHLAPQQTLNRNLHSAKPEFLNKSEHALFNSISNARGYPTAENFLNTTQQPSLREQNPNIPCFGTFQNSPQQGYPHSKRDYSRHFPDHSFSFHQQPITFLKGLASAISLIPDYYGHADLLPVFCSSILNVRNAFGPASEPWILNALASKLKGSAATGFAARLTQYNTIGPLLRDLKQQYWGREGVDSLKRKLQTITQDPTENAASFGLRVQSIHNSLINALDQDPNIFDSHREILKQIAIKDACEQFLCGLRPELEAATRAKRPVLLSEAIDAAISHESCRGTRDSKTSPENVTYNIFRRKRVKIIEHREIALQNRVIFVKELDMKYLNVGLLLEVLTKTLQPI